MGQVIRQAMLDELWQVYQERGQPAYELMAALAVYLTDQQLRDVIRAFRAGQDAGGDNYIESVREAEE